MHKISVATLLIAFVIGGCAGANPPQTSEPPMSRDAPMPRAASFTAWRDGFRSRALAQGISPQVFDAAFQGVEVNADVVRLDLQALEQEMGFAVGQRAGW